MESADLHHHQHQLQEQLIGSSSLATSTPSFSTTFTNNNAWNPNLILIAGNLNSNINGLLSNSSSTDSRQNCSDINLVPPSNPSMIQELGFHEWASNNEGNNFSSHSAHELHLARIKEEFPKFSDTTMNGAAPPSNLEEFHFPSTSYIKHELQDLNNTLSHEKLLLKTFSSACQLNGLHHQAVSAGDDDPHQFYSNSQSCASFGGVATSNRENFSQIFPRNLDPPCSSFSSSLGMNLQTLDLWNPTKFGGSSTQPPQHNNNLGLFKQAAGPSFVLDHLQESSHTPSYITNKISSFMMMNGSASSSSSSAVNTDQTKRSSSSSDHHHQSKTSHHNHVASKKPRTESRSSFPPFKVRKEKLGDRIAALQQLVAPFGKTDTASVLMEAIGYIKFLQDQVETLSVPYMKSSRNITRSSGQGSCLDTQGSYMVEGSNEGKRDLRSRGLCLVPLSCTSYVTNDDGGSVWSVPNFGGGA
ncbi:Myc-type [Macleaya cordata]|uniref:Myc-type n=1 Tax=Macleaya cordata TaxID=56857 RepID=A0A200R7R4_MACCD|nr:Myc-type [Macleaya cordata]